MNKRLQQHSVLLDTLAGYLAALLKRISKNWGGKQLQPVPVKARN